MIPKIIHYCWFGGKEIPRNLRRYLKSWEINKGYKVMRWDESNTAIEDIPYLKNAFEHKKWANLSNLTRLIALKEYGGIYLDTDIEILKPFDDILDNECFLGFEDKFVDWDGCVNNAVMGSVPNHWFIILMEKELLQNFDGTELAHLSSPNLTTRLLKELGMNTYGAQCIKGLQLFEIEYFYPYSWYEVFNPNRITPNTYTIHHFQQSWSGKASKKEIKKVLKKKFYLLKWSWMKLLKKGGI